MATSRRGAAARPQIVKSAERTLRILELFDEVKEPQTVIELCRRLGYPQSSTSALLKSLTLLGYLDHDPIGRTYVPTERVSLLGAWNKSRQIGEPPLVRMIHASAQRVGQTVILAARNRDFVQYVHVENNHPGAGRSFQPGTHRPLHKTATGLALMSGMRDADVKGMYHRLNAYCRSPDEIVNVPDLLTRLQKVRVNGYALVSDDGPADLAFVAVRLPPDCSSRTLAVAAGGPREATLERHREIVGILKEEIDTHLVRSEDSTYATFASPREALMDARS